VAGAEEDQVPLVGHLRVRCSLNGDVFLPPPTVIMGESRLSSLAL
jgi:hypothetical protein